MGELELFGGAKTLAVDPRAGWAWRALAIVGENQAKDECERNGVVGDGRKEAVMDDVVDGGLGKKSRNRIRRRCCDCRRFRGVVDYSRWRKGSKIGWGMEKMRARPIKRLYVT